MVDLIERDLILRYFRYLKDEFRNKEGPLEYLMKKLIEYIEKVPSAEQDRHICRECKWVKFYGNVDKNGNVESMWFCTNWDGVTDEEGFCHEWESR